MVCDESPGVVSYILTIFSLLLVLVTLPFSLLYTVKVVQVIPATGCGTHQTTHQSLIIIIIRGFIFIIDACVPDGLPIHIKSIQSIC